jgi:Mce-associated membrane protein
MVREHRAVVRDTQITAEFVAAARQAVVTLLSMNFQSAKEDAQRVVADSTGQFHDDFSQHLDDFTTALEQSKVVTTAKVNGAAVQSRHGDSATVLVTATSDVTNSSGAQHEPRSWRLIVTMTRAGGQLKMSGVEFVP